MRAMPVRACRLTRLGLPSGLRRRGQARDATSPIRMSMSPAQLTARQFRPRSQFTVDVLYHGFIQRTWCNDRGTYDSPICNTRSRSPRPSCLVHLKLSTSEGQDLSVRRGAVARGHPSKLGACCPAFRASALTAHVIRSTCSGSQRS